MRIPSSLTLSPLCILKTGPPLSPPATPVLTRTWQRYVPSQWTLLASSLSTQVLETLPWTWAATSADRQYGVILECVAGVTDDAVVSCVRVDGDAAVADGLGDPAPVVLDS